MKTIDFYRIFLVDHAWTFRPHYARQQLHDITGLLERMKSLLDIDDDDDESHLIDRVLEKIWNYSQTYSVRPANTVCQSKN